MSVVRRAAIWLLPPAILIVLYRHGLQTWFLQDDFAWLQLAAGVWNGDSIWKALFTPMAQGTVRPLSERAFFIVLYGLFGLDAVPFRILVFAVQAANLALIGWIARKLTGSGLAAVAAPVFWACGSCLYVVMTWNSAFNQALCAFCLLAAFAFLLRWTSETGARRARDEWLEWIAYLAGFAALEITVVYPLLAAAYAAVFAPRSLPRVLWRFAPAAVFTAVHLAFVPKVLAGSYRMRFDFSMAGSLWTYWQWALGPSQLAMVARLPAWLPVAVTALLTAAALGFAAARWLGSDRLPGYFLFWFVITLAPVLPLKDHVSDYYLTIPSIGLALLGAHAVALARRSAPLPAALACAAAAAYLVFSIPSAAMNTRATFRQSKRVKATVLGVAYAHQLRPSAVLALSGVDTGLFWDCVRDRGFELAGASQVYIPESEASSIQVPHDVLDAYVVPGEALERGIEKGRVQVYDVRGERLKNVTAMFRIHTSGSKPPRRIDVGNPLLDYTLLDGWYSLEKGFRWMRGRAGVRLGGPDAARQRIRVSGRCPEALVQKGSLAVRLAVDGAPAGEAVIRAPGAFELEFVPPAIALGRERTDVTIDMDRTFRPPSSARDLGLVLGVIEVR
jgi:hypothetical protein